MALAAIFAKSASEISSNGSVGSPSSARSGAPDWTYTEEDRDSALGKMTSCAVSYDPNAPSALKLTSFQGLTLTPQAFKEAVRTTFNLVLKVRPIPTYLSLSSLPRLSFVP